MSSEQPVVATVVEVPAARRFEARDRHGTLLGVADYQRMGAVIGLTRTQVPEEFAGHGVASELLRQTFDQLRASGRRAAAFCPYVRAWLDRNPEYRELIGPSSQTA